MISFSQETRELGQPKNGETVSPFSKDTRGSVKALGSHPASETFPLMQGQEYRELLKDIQEHSQREPILVHPDGRILDGRNRWRVCCELGIEPKVRAWEDNGDSPLSVVLSLNLHRRHLTSSQKAAIAVELLPVLREEARKRMVAGAEATNTGRQKIDYPGGQGKATEQAARMAGTNREYVTAAEKIREKSPELLTKVRDGKLHVADALKKVVEDHGKKLPTPK